MAEPAPPPVTIGPLVASLISAVCGALVAAHLLIRFKYDTLKDGLDPVALGLIALGLSPWIARVVESFKFGGVEFTFVKQQIAQQGEDIEALKFLFSNYLNEYELRHLERIAGDNEFMVDTTAWPEEFKREIGRLRAVGLITNFQNTGLRVMYDGTAQYRNAKDYFYVTEKGKQYLQMLKERGYYKPVEDATA